MDNSDKSSVDHFGAEWSTYTQEDLSADELKHQFGLYFSILDFEKLPAQAVGLDMGCGSGRWAKIVSERVGRLYCADASPQALEIARQNLVSNNNCEFINCSFEDIPIENESLDFVYCLGVLHHIPDTLMGIRSCANKLKPGSPLLAYIYYSFENKPVWYRLLWRMSNLVRMLICRLGFRSKKAICLVIAVLIYLPLARMSWLLEKLGLDVGNFPLSSYRNWPFYSMKTDALDRFGTPLEKRFSKAEISEMFTECGLERIHFSDDIPYWCVVGYKSGEDNRS